MMRKWNEKCGQYLNDYHWMRNRYKWRILRCALFFFSSARALFIVEWDREYHECETNRNDESVSIANHAFWQWAMIIIAIIINKMTKAEKNDKDLSVKLNDAPSFRRWARERERGRQKKTSDTRQEKLYFDRVNIVAWEMITMFFHFTENELRRVFFVVCVCAAYAIGKCSHLMRSRYFKAESNRYSPLTCYCGACCCFASLFILFFFPKKKYRHCCYMLALWMLYDFVFFSSFGFLFVCFLLKWKKSKLLASLSFSVCVCVLVFSLCFFFHFPSFSFVSHSLLADILIPNIDLALNYVVVVILNFELYPARRCLDLEPNVRIPLNYIVNERIRNFYHFPNEKEMKHS